MNFNDLGTPVDCDVRYVCNFICEYLTDKLLDQNPASDFEIRIAYQRDTFFVLGTISEDLNLFFNTWIPEALRMFPGINSLSQCGIVNMAESSKIVERGDMSSFSEASSKTEKYLPQTSMLVLDIVSYLSEENRKNKNSVYLKSVDFANASDSVKINELTFVSKEIVESLEAKIRSDLSGFSEIKSFFKEDSVFTFKKIESVDNLAGQFAVSSQKKNFDVRRSFNFLPGIGHSINSFYRIGPLVARWIAVSLVHADLCSEVKVVVKSLKSSPEVKVDVHSSNLAESEYNDVRLVKIVKKNFDLNLKALASELDLSKIIFQSFAGSVENLFKPELKWETPKVLEITED
mgnify:CR=1 FL=1